MNGLCCCEHHVRTFLASPKARVRMLRELPAGHGAVMGAEGRLYCPACPACNHTEAP